VFFFGSSSLAFSFSFSRASWPSWFSCALICETCASPQKSRCRS
jgi:hypothetical protein